VGRLQREMVVDASPEAVFGFLAEPERLPEWTPGVLAVRRTSPGPVGVGSTTETLVEAFGMRQTLLGRCTAFEPPKRLVVQNQTSGGMKVGAVTIGKIESTSTSELLPEAGGTRLRASLEYTISAGFMSGLAETLVGSKMQADFEQSLQTLKRLLESRPASG